MPLLREALATFRELDLPKLVVWTLIGLTGASLKLDDDVTNGRAFCTEALAIALAHGFTGAVNAARGTLADLEFRAGDAQAALLLAGDALAEARRTNRAMQQAYHACNMALYASALGDFAEARSHAREALEVSRRLGTDYVTTVILQHFAAIAALRPQRDATLAARDRVRAGRLIGYVDAAFEALGSSRDVTERGEHDRLMAALSTALGADKLATLTKDGSRWPVERAVEEALLI
jgi:tetratricopeptide (TPR) repeat protein